MSRVTLCNFASGSTGNCTYIATETTRILIDAGISAKRIKGHVEELEASLGELQGVCVTHEHIDHISALPQLHGRHGVPLYGNAGTVQAMARKEKYRDLHWNVFTNGQRFDIGDISLQPYSIPHDAFDPVGFIVEAHGYRIGFATDIGLPTRLIRHQLQGCHALVLETNHDRLMLEESARPWPLKQRIAGRQGHLSNEEAADLLRDVAGPELQCVYLAHLSQDCNEPALAESQIRLTLKEMGREDVKLHPTFPKQASTVWVSGESVSAEPMEPGA